MNESFEHLDTVAEKLDSAAERMMGMQEDADGTDEIVADYAWLRDDEIEWIAYNLFNSIKDESNAVVCVNERCVDDRWPVRIMMRYTEALLQNPDLYRDKEIDWLAEYRTQDPDPTGP